MKKIKVDQRGDTIVEVLICIAILGFTLSAAYTLTNRNQIATQKSLERTQAIKLAETQLERLRAYVDVHRNDTGFGTSMLMTPSASYCIVEDTVDASGFKIESFSAGNSPAPLVENDVGATNAYPSACVQGFFQIAVWAPNATGVPTSGVVGADSVNKPFAVTIRWDSPGSGRDEVKMFYKVQQ